MTTATKRTHKHFQLDSAKIKRAQKALRAKTETEAIERALDSRRLLREYPPIARLPATAWKPRDR